MPLAFVHLLRIHPCALEPSWHRSSGAHGFKMLRMLKMLKHSQCGSCNHTLNSVLVSNSISRPTRSQEHQDNITERLCPCWRNNARHRSEFHQFGADMPRCNLLCKGPRVHSPGEVVCMPSFDQLRRRWRRSAFHVRLDDIILRREHLCLIWGENVLTHSYHFISKIGQFDMNVVLFSLQIRDARCRGSD